MSEDPIPPTGIADVRGKSLGLIAQQDGDVEGMSRILPGFNAKPLRVAAFNSSI